MKKGWEKQMIEFCKNIAIGGFWIIAAIIVIMMLLTLVLIILYIVMELFRDV